MFSNELWNKSGVPATFSIDQSIRFNSADTAYMHRTPSSTGNRRTFTSSFWVKLGKLNVNTALPMPGVTHGIGSSGLSLTTANVLNAYIYYAGSWSGLLVGTRVFRDPAAWYNFVTVVDTTDSTASERIRIYINGQRETNFSSEAYPSQNTDTDWNLSGEKMWIGIDPSGSAYNGEYYAAEIVYIDGTAYGPENFGETNDSGIWIPKDVSGLTFGTNGFHIKGEDASDLGNDSSSNNNDFTTSGLASHDQVVGESPTNNFAVYNILYNVGDVDFPTYSEGNLSVDFNFYGKRSPVSTFALPTDSDAYCEFYIKTSSASNSTGVGIGQGDANNTGNVVLTNGVTYNLNGNKTTGGSFSSFGNTYTAGDIIGVYFDQSDNEVDFYKNNTLEGSISLSALSGDLFFLVANNTTSQQVIIANFGQDDTFAGNKTSGSAGSSDSSGNGKFYYSRISGAKALCSKSLGS